MFGLVFTVSFFLPNKWIVKSLSDFHHVAINFMVLVVYTVNIYIYIYNFEYTTVEY